MTAPSGSARLLARSYLSVLRWRVEGAIPPDLRKAVVVAAPHTSNWDMPHMLAVALCLGVRPSWLGKREMFRRPFGGFFRWLGGLPVDRSRRRDLVRQIVDRFRDSEALMLVIAPAGTRGGADHWKSGFYQIARAAEVPILCGFLDYRRRVGGILGSLSVTGDAVADMDRIRELYRGIVGKHPEKAAEIRLQEEAAEIADGEEIESAAT